MQKARDQCSTMLQRLLEKSFSSRISLRCNKILLRPAWKHKPPQSIPEIWWLSLLVEPDSEPDTTLDTEQQAPQMCCKSSLLS